MRFLVKVILNAVALWLTTLIVAGHILVKPFGEEGWQVVLSYLVVALVFGIVNSVIGTVIRVVAFPLYILTLGLISLIVNALLLWIVHWLSGLFGWGLVIEGGFWWGVLGALVLGIISWILGLIFRPLTKREGRNHR
ncbi:MAG TPA: phage holin family protein [Microbacteriaceae bacterium]|nr:phage holin family protein [Microbacteriaceae bacterium]